MSLTRQFCFSIDPLTGLSNTYSWHYAQDGNSDGYAIMCAYVPQTKGNKISLFQETLFLGCSGGKTLQTLREDLTRDGDDEFTAEAITGRIAPTMLEAGVTHAANYHHIEMPSINSFEKGLTIEVAKDAIDPVREAVTWEALYRTAGHSIAYISNGLARWLHLRIRDAGSGQRGPIFNSFILHYYDLFTRDESSL